MNIIFFGTSEFAIPSLRAISGSHHKILALVTQPDRKRGRDLKLSPPPTKVLALTKDILVYQPADASSRDAASYLKKLNADLFVVVSFGQILKEHILEIPKLYAINLHGSLLPKYRGAAPTNWAVINGDRSSGVTIIKMNEKMDEGEILLKKEAGIGDDDTNITLSEKLSLLGADAVIEALDLIEKNKNLNFTKQDAAAATYAPKLKKEDGLIDWKEPAVKIHNKVRGLLPWPAAYTRYENKVLKVLQTEIVQSAPNTKDAKPGEVVDIIKNKGLIVRTGSGNIIIKYLQLEGKIVLDADSFLRGHKIPVGYVFF